MLSTPALSTLGRGSRAQHMVASRTDRGWLLLLAAVVLALRVAVVVGLCHDPPPTYEHGEIARNLVAGHGFSVRFLGATGPTSQQAPLYPALLAALYAMRGVDSPSALWTMQMLQAASGALVVLATAWLGWLVWPQQKALGWCAAALVAVYPPQIYQATHIQVAVWSSLALTAALACAYRAGASAAQAAYRPALVAGLAGGAAVLVEPIHVLAWPVLALVSTGVIEGGRAALGRQWHRGAAWCLAALVTVAPWLVRNAVVHGEFVFVKSSFGYAFWQGNNTHSWGTDKVPHPGVALIAKQHPGTWAAQHRALGEARRETWYIDDVVLQPADYARLAPLTEPQRSRSLGRAAWREVRAHPRRYLALCATRLRYFLLFDATNPKASHPLYQASTVVWLVLGSVGLLTSGELIRRAWPLAVVFLTVLAFHTLTITSARFRLPLEPLSMLAAAWAMVPLGARLMRQASSARGASQPPTVVARPDLLDPPQPLAGPHRRVGQHRHPAREEVRRRRRAG